MFWQYPSDLDGQIVSKAITGLKQKCDKNKNCKWYSKSNHHFMINSTIQFRVNFFISFKFIKTSSK